MFIVITGLDGSGTSTVAELLHEMDEGSILTRTPSAEYSNREHIDGSVREISQKAHYLYYLSSVLYISDKIKKENTYKEKNVYCVRYLIDTVVSHRVAGLDVDLDYDTYDILKPDLTIFVKLDEVLRQKRITERGKSKLDKVLDNEKKREEFNKNFDYFLKLEDNPTIVFNNNSSNVENNVKGLLQLIKKRGK
jgi:thymidylate kinase